MQRVGWQTTQGGDEHRTLRSRFKVACHMLVVRVLWPKVSCTYALGIIMPTSDNGFLIRAHVGERQGQQPGGGGRKKSRMRQEWDGSRNRRALMYQR